MPNNPKQDPGLTVEEVLEAVRHSSLRNVLVEGPYDVEWYGILLEKAGVAWEPMQAGGRNTPLKVYEAMNAQERSSVVFVADRDMWYFSGVPSEYSDIVFTTGYSIENDVLRDSVGYGLLNPGELKRIAAYKTVLSEWFAFCVAEYKNGNDPKTDVYPAAIAEEQNGAVAWRMKYQKQIGYVPPPASEIQKVLSDFELGFRGKCLADLYSMVMLARKKPAVRYSNEQLMDVSLREKDISGLRLMLLQRIEAKIATRSIVA